MALRASASSGLPVSISSAVGSCTVANRSLLTVKASGVGQCIVTFEQSGNSTWNAGWATLTISSKKAVPTLDGFVETFTWDPSLVETANRGFHVPLAGTSQVPFTFEVVSGDCQGTGGHAIDFDRYGSRTCEVKASGQASDLYEAFAETRSVTLRSKVIDIEVVIGPKFALTGTYWPVLVLRSRNSEAIPSEQSAQGGCSTFTGNDGLLTLAVPPEVSGDCEINFVAGAIDMATESGCKKVRFNRLVAIVVACY